MAGSGVRVIHPGDRLPDSSAAGVVREAAVSGPAVGSKRLWAGYVELPPDLVSGVHHHGEAENVVYVLSGMFRVLTGEALEETHDAGPGDFLWLPPFAVHAELNPSHEEPVRMVVARSTQETLVVPVTPPDGWTAAQPGDRP